MALEIQGAVNSMIGSVGNVIQQNEENKRKALRIVASAVSGGLSGGPAGAIKGVAKGVASEAGVDTKSMNSIIDGVATQASPQAQAASMANQSVYNAIEAKKTQKAKNDALVEAHNKREQAITKRLSEGE